MKQIELPSDSMPAPPKNLKDSQNVSQLISIQAYAKSGNFEELEKILTPITNPSQNIKQSLDSALVEAICQARSSTEHFMCAKLLYSKGANLNPVLKGIFHIFVYFI